MLFPDCNRRINRAISHGKAARLLWEGIADPEAHPVRIEINEDGTEGIAKTQLPQLAENDIALELGECFYQLRAALDSLIYQVLVYVDNVDPPTNGEKSEFPVCIDEGKFKRNAVNRAPFPAELRDWLLSVQPYTATDPSHPNNQLSRYLLLLHDFARLDRHRRLHLVGTAIAEIGVKFKPSPGVTISGVDFVGGNLFEDEAVFLRFNVSGFKGITNRKIELESKFGVEIAIKDFPIPENSTLAREFSILIEAVKFVWQHFEDSFGPNLSE